MSTARESVDRPLHRLLTYLLNRVPTASLHALLANAAKRRALTLSPADGLRFLFNLDAALYPVQGQLAVAYGAGTHTKHRHTNYHEFFASRIRQGERVLDLGCGIGAVAYSIASNTGAQVVGVDLNANNIARARQDYAHPMVQYHVGDIRQEFPSGLYDVVVLSNVLEHLQQRPAMLRRISTTVQPSRFLIRVPISERDWRVPLKRELGIEWRLDHTHYVEYTQETFADELAAAGLRITYLQTRWGEIWAEAVPIVSA